MLVTEPASCVDKAQGVMLGTIIHTVPLGRFKGCFPGCDMSLAAPSGGP